MRGLVQKTRRNRAEGPRNGGAQNVTRHRGRTRQQRQAVDSMDCGANVCFSHRDFKCMRSHSTVTGKNRRQKRTGHQSSEA